MRAYSILFSRRKTAEETPGANLEDGTQAAGVRVEEICVHIYIERICLYVSRFKFS